MGTHVVWLLTFYKIWFLCFRFVMTREWLNDQLFFIFTIILIVHITPICKFISQLYNLYLISFNRYGFYDWRDLRRILVTHTIKFCTINKRYRVTKGFKYTVISTHIALRPTIPLRLIPSQCLFLSFLLYAMACLPTYCALRREGTCQRLKVESRRDGVCV